MKSNIEMLNDIYDFFTYLNQGLESKSHKYFDGDWFWYRGNNIVEISEGKKPFIIKNVIKDSYEVEVTIITLKKSGKEISDDFVEDNKLILGFSLDTIIDTDFFIADKRSQFHGYTELTITHDGFPSETFSYEPAGE